MGGDTAARCERVLWKAGYSWQLRSGDGDSEPILQRPCCLASAREEEQGDSLCLVLSPTNYVTGGVMNRAASAVRGAHLSRDQREIFRGKRVLLPDEQGAKGATSVTVDPR